ncbi:type II secretion system protein E [gamma proteobacterium BDW918]|nr:type II secretion system protein E [gamma proteobacterium BDW918]
MNILGDESKEKGGADYFRRLRGMVHRRLIDTLDSDGAKSLGDTSQVKEKLEWIVNDLSRSRGVEISQAERNQLEREILEELSGMGPLAPFMLEDDITDILVNGAHEIWIDRAGRLQKTDARFDDEAHLRRFLDRIIGVQGRHLDASTPMVDAKLADGSRLHAVIPPLCSKGAVVSIRRFRKERIEPADLVTGGFISQPMLDLLQMAVAAGVNVVVAGSAAAGKTTLLNVLSKSIPDHERIITIEETSELRLDHPHVIPLESRPGNLEGIGSVNLRELVRTALRMRADRIIVGEVRGGEVMDMLQAMNVGHDGSLTTVHANSLADVLRRLESLALMSDSGVPRDSVKEMIASAIQVVVHVMRFRDGSRRVVSLGEVVRDGGELSVKELFRFKAEGLNDEGRIQGKHWYTGEKVDFLERVEAQGFSVDIDLGPVLDVRSAVS